MDNKTWLWKKRSTAKTLEADKSNEILRCEEGKTEGPLLEKKELERDLKLLNEKLASALAESDAKDNIVMKQVKIAEDAIAGWEKAEKEAVSLKQELDEVLKQKAASEERLVNTDAALLECMEELRRVREKQDKTVITASEDRDMSNAVLGKKLAEALERIVKLEAENSRIAKAGSVKDQVIEDLSKCRTQIEADFNALISRLDATRKGNDSLKYEVRVLQKELQIRNEEQEFYRRRADASEKQLQENAKRTAELEAECQRLGVLVSKRLSDASASLSELEHFRNEKLRTSSNRITMLASDMNLMDDFAEMEKLAVVSVNNSSGSENILQMSKDKGSDLDASEKRINCSSSNADKSGKKIQEDVSIPISKILELLEGMNTKVMENLVKDDDNKLLPYKNSESSTGYVVRVFQWRSAELSTVLQRFIQVCHDLQNGTANLEQFVRQVASDLDWVMNHCFSLQDVSSMKESFINRLYWDESVSETEVALGSVDHFAEGERPNMQRQDVLYPLAVSNISVRNESCQIKASQPIITEEFKTWNNELADKEYSGMDLEAMLQSEIANGECLRTQLQESKSMIAKLQSEIESMKQSQGIDGNQIQIQKSMTQNDETNHEFKKDGLNNSHSQNPPNLETKSFQKLDESHGPKILSERSGINEAKPDRKRANHFQNDWEITAASEKLAKCQETILDLGKQLKSLASPNEAAVFDKVLSKSSVSVSNSSSSMGTSTSTSKKRSTLLDKMLAEDNARLASSFRTAITESQKGISSSALSNSSTMGSLGNLTTSNKASDDNKGRSKTAAANMDIVTRWRDNDDDKSFFKRLFRRRKKGKNGKVVS